MAHGRGRDDVRRGGHHGAAGTGGFNGVTTGRYSGRHADADAAAAAAAAATAL